MIDYNELIEKAKDARRKSYSPYSNFCVGAALLTEDDKIYKGCNIENAAFPTSTCAERTAIVKAISEGEYNFKAIAIVGIKKDSKGDEKPCFPCGVCLQIMTEFCDAEIFEIVIAKNNDEYQVYKLKELIPFSFKTDFLL